MSDWVLNTPLISDKCRRGFGTLSNIDDENVESEQGPKHAYAVVRFVWSSVIFFQVVPLAGVPSLYNIKSHSPTLICMSR